MMFPNEEESIKLFDWICKNKTSLTKVEEFINWHTETNNEVIKEITITKKIDLTNKKEATKWATEFLEDYDEKIRKMRNTSNLVFQRFHELIKKFKR